MTILKKIGLIINIIAKIAIAYYLFDWTVAQFIPIEFSDNRITQHINLYSIFIIPIAIILTLFGLVKKSREKNYIIQRTIWTLVTAIVFAFIMVSFGPMFLLGSAKITGMTIFENKNNSKIKIVERIDDAGLFGQGPTVIYKIRPFVPLLIIATKIDTTELDKNEWTRINRR
jgi:hypothetical protein